MKKDINLILNYNYNYKIYNIMKNIIYFYLFISLISSFLIIYYLYNRMTQHPIYAIAVFNDTIKGTVRFTEDLVNNQIKIELNIT